MAGLPTGDTEDVRLSTRLKVVLSALWGFNSRLQIFSLPSGITSATAAGT